MKTVKVNVYQFEELNDKAKDKVRSLYYEWSDLEQWNEDAKEQIESAGFVDPELIYSLSYCQGDGLSFKAAGLTEEKQKEILCSLLGPGKEKRAQIIIDSGALAIELKGNSGHYAFSSRHDVDAYLDSYFNEDDHIYLYNLICDFNDVLESDYINLCSQLEAQGYNEIEYQQSDEYITEEVEANERFFTIDGELFS